jgi:hypothetical protein
MRSSIIILAAIPHLALALPHAPTFGRRTPLFSELFNGAKSVINAVTGSGSNSTNAEKATQIQPADAVSQFIRPAQFSQAAYCSAGAVTNWKCGPPCDNLPNVQVLTAGGDDGLIPGCEILSS